MEIPSIFLASENLGGVESHHIFLGLCVSFPGVQMFVWFFQLLELVFQKKNKKHTQTWSCVLKPHRIHAWIYGKCTCMYHKSKPNVGNYSIHSVHLGVDKANDVFLPPRSQVFSRGHGNELQNTAGTQSSLAELVWLKNQLG